MRDCHHSLACTTGHRATGAGVLWFAVMLAACSGGGDAYHPGTDLPASDGAAVRFLTQTTFGATEPSLARLEYLGYATWLQEQLDQPPTLYRPPLEQQAASGVALSNNDRQELFWRYAIAARDQLRQRVALALSEVFVVSDADSGLNTDYLVVLEYYDTLLRGAFGNYRQLLEDVTLSPAMGRYLGMLGNRKPDPIRHTRPDENYAREVMQLFSVGLVQLNPDGTPRLDGLGNTIPTYTQDDIQGLASVFTGWHYHGATTQGQVPSYLPMTAVEAWHDTAAKQILDGTVFPAGGSAAPELAGALDHLANHANVGPFLGRQLIQRLVTSNPSPAYVARVAAIWANDGSGARGNLGAVVRAILLDDEAKHGAQTAPATFGKLKEPLLRQAQIWRAFGGHPKTNQFGFFNPEQPFGEAMLRSDTVFNFFRPDHEPLGELASLDLQAPEFQILNHTTVTRTANQFNKCLFRWHVGNIVNAEDFSILCDFGRELAVAADANALVARLDRILLAGNMPAAMRQLLLDHLAQVTDPLQRVQDAIWLIVTSPQFAVQK